MAFEGESFYWYDLETSGLNPRWDRIVQFAGVRTDQNLEVVEDSWSSYVRLPVDVLPNPESVAVTGITPQIAAQGIDEWEAMGRINTLFAKPKTCVIGYNSLRFDDEFVRFGLYRTLRDPYAREWQNGNSRWDLIDLVRATAALRPDGIEWPQVDGVPAFRLELLSAANGIEHGHAHDAHSDVEATLGLARLIKEKQPKLFAYYFGIRRKKAIKALLEPTGKTLCVHVSGMYPKSRLGLAPIISLASHPKNGNSIIVADLLGDIRSLLEWSEDRLRENLFSKDPEIRPPLKEIRINRCPFVAKANVVTGSVMRRLKIDMQLAEANFHRLAGAGISRKIARVYQLPDLDKAKDVDAGLYDGFLSSSDGRACTDFETTLASGIWPDNSHFTDPRLNALKPRLKARSFPHTLDESERTQWAEFVAGKLTDETGDWLTLSKFKNQLAALEGKDELAAQLRQYVADIESELHL